LIGAKAALREHRLQIPEDISLVVLMILPGQDTWIHR